MLDQDYKLSLLDEAELEEGAEKVAPLDPLATEEEDEEEEKPAVEEQGV